MECVVKTYVNSPGQVSLKSGKLFSNYCTRQAVRKTDIEMLVEVKQRQKMLKKNLKERVNKERERDRESERGTEQVQPIM